MSSSFEVSGATHLFEMMHMLQVTWWLLCLHYSILTSANSLRSSCDLKVLLRPILTGSKESSFIFLESRSNDTWLPYKINNGIMISVKTWKQIFLISVVFSLQKTWSFCSLSPSKFVYVKGRLKKQIFWIIASPCLQLPRTIKKEGW